MRGWSAVAALALVSCSGGCEPVLGPDGEVARQLQSLKPGATFDLSGVGPLTLESIRFDHLLVKPEGEGMVAVTSVDLEAASAAGLHVSYIGLERIPYVKGERGWGVKGAAFPNLAAIAALLTERAQALGRQDPALLEPLVARAWKDPRFDRTQALALARERLPEFAAYRARRWIVRSERMAVEVLEEYEAGPTATPRRGQVRFQLVREDGRLRFASGML